MTKNHTFLVILALLLSFTLFCCTPDGNTITTTTNDTRNETTSNNEEKPGETQNFEGLSAETEWQMKRDFFWTYLYSDSRTDPLGIYLYPASTTVDEVQIYYYFGNYNGYEVAAFLTGPMETQLASNSFRTRYADLLSYVIYGTLSMGDYDKTVFQFPHPAAMLAWKPNENAGSGHFYTMQAAYDLGLLTRNDMQSMHDLYYDMGPFEDLDKETKTRIVVAWCGDNAKSFEDLDEEGKSAAVYNFWDFIYYSFTYLGTYHDYVIFSRGNGWDTSSYMPVYDFVFYYTTGPTSMYAWHKGNGLLYFMGYDDDYKEIDYKDFLTAEDVKSMWERYLIRMKSVFRY